MAGRPLTERPRPSRRPRRSPSRRPARRRPGNHHSLQLRRQRGPHHRRQTAKAPDGWPRRRPTPPSRRRSLDVMTCEREPRLYVNRWGDTSDPSPERRGSRQDACACFDQSKPQPRARVGFHTERQDTSAAGWQHLLELVDEAIADGREEFRPLTELSPEERRQIITLPPSIARLTAVKDLVLYGSNLVRIPPEIGCMTNLEEFTPYTPYTSYRLHWFLRDNSMPEADPQHSEHARVVRQREAAATLPEASAFPGVRRGPRSGEPGSPATGRHLHPSLQRLQPSDRTGRPPSGLDLATRGHRRAALAGQRLLVGVCRRTARRCEGLHPHTTHRRPSRPAAARLGLIRLTASQAVRSESLHEPEAWPPRSSVAWPPRRPHSSLTSLREAARRRHPPGRGTSRPFGRARLRRRQVPRHPASGAGRPGR